MSSSKVPSDCRLSLGYFGPSHESILASTTTEVLGLAYRLDVWLQHLAREQGPGGIVGINQDMNNFITPRRGCTHAIEQCFSLVFLVLH